VTSITKEVVFAQEFTGFLVNKLINISLMYADCQWRHFYSSL